MVLRWVLVLLFVWVAPAVAAPVIVTEVDRTIQNRLVRGWVAVVDLSDPTVEIVVTGPAPEGTGAEAVLARTDIWQQANGLRLAINANYFGTLPDGKADIIGLSVSDGVIVSGARRFGSNPHDPALMFDNDGMATIGGFSNADAQQARDAVAGVGPSNTDAVPGTQLVTDGQNTGPTARVDPGARNPRTAAGVSEDGRTLILMAIDGRQPGWSEGVTLGQLADLMIEFGAWDAINLDGGGSTAFVSDDGTTRRTNRPSDGQFRAVANHLGVRINASLPPDAQTRRKIRGVWLRPPTSLSTLDANFQTLAACGIRDVFLETFYWGLATNTSAVFQDRFGFDYLEEAIRIGAARGIRVHAWLETAYWSYGGSGDYILDQHPEWKVTDHNENTDIGDVPGQVFVNIGLAGVQDMLAAYCAELARYPGLWGIQTDYHRFPLDNNTSDGQSGPYSYDFNARLEFFGQYGVDPLVGVRGPGATLWSQWVAFRRARIAKAAEVMNDAIESVDPGLQFSGAIFAQAMSSSAQLVKMQDWPTMAQNGWLELIVPMAYATSTSGIRNDLRTALDSAGPARVVAGLAILTNQSRPSLSQQFAAAKGEGVEDFILFDANTLLGSVAMQNELRSFLLTQASFQDADFNRDTDVDARDWAFFEFAYQSAPGAPPAGFEQADLNANGVMDDEDRAIFRDRFRRFRFNADGVVGEKQLAAFHKAFTGAGPGGFQSGVLGLFDLDGDGDVDYQDQLVLHTLLTAPIPFDLDVSADGRVDVDDLHELSRTPRDVNRDGTIDQDDRDLLERIVRDGELDGDRSAP
jgi:exopolysaccharide biosynthesis protein/uncharacterized lipoprotein YddW (UPF0748 family)